jgi:hypothetical protein
MRPPAGCSAGRSRPVMVPHGNGAYLVVRHVYVVFLAFIVNVHVFCGLALEQLLRRVGNAAGRQPHHRVSRSPCSIREQARPAHRD